LFYLVWAILKFAAYNGKLYQAVLLIRVMQFNAVDAAKLESPPGDKQKILVFM
jgi:hypothetical protein